LRLLGAGARHKGKNQGGESHACMLAPAECGVNGGENRGLGDQTRRSPDLLSQKWFLAQLNTWRGVRDA
jgi:hypothetical protein